MRVLGVGLFFVVLAAGCGGSTVVENAVTEIANEDLEPTSTVAAVEDDPVSSELVDVAETDDGEADDVEETAEAPAVDVPTPSWDGPRVVPLLDARMAELAAPFGSTFSPEAVASLFAMPADFPYPEGPITGIMHTWDLDERVTDEIDIEEERIVGLAGDSSAAVLDSIADSVGEGSDSRWARSSAQRQEGQAYNDLFTSEDGDGDGFTDRLVLTSDIAPDPDESDVKITVEFAAGEIPETNWMAGLPVPAGGRLVEVLEGMGLVKDFGRPGGNGTVTARWSYSVDAAPSLADFLNSGVVGAAGFDHEDLSVTADDPTGRFDVSIGDWEGQLLVSTFSIGDTDPAGYHVAWFLSRA